MLLEERQHISNYATLCAPVGIRVPKPVVLLGFVHNAKLIQLVLERVVRVHVVPDRIVARPVKLETTWRLLIVRILGVSTPERSYLLIAR